MSEEELKKEMEELVKNKMDTFIECHKNGMIFGAPTDIEFYEKIATLQQKVEEKNKEIDRLNNITNELTDLILLKKARAENEKDYSRYYIENFSKALKETHSTPDGIMLETIKSTTIKTCSDLLDKLKKLKEDNK